jgi:hypothetical protein
VPSLLPSRRGHLDFRRRQAEPPLEMAKAPAWGQRTPTVPGAWQV